MLSFTYTSTIKLCLRKKQHPFPKNIPMDSNCQLKNESPFTIYWCHRRKLHTNTSLHWHMTYKICFLDKMPAVSAFEGDGRIRIWTSEARLSIDPCRGEKTQKSVVEEEHLLFFCMVQASFLGKMCFVYWGYLWFWKMFTKRCHDPEPS